MYIQTYTGKKFDILEPTVDMVCVQDISMALGAIQRYGGHAQHTYSVAEHSINVRRCVEGASVEWLEPAALFHDAAEAYIGDIVTPLKRLLDAQSHGALRLIEERVLEVICTRFGIDPALMNHPAIKHADSCSVIAAEIQVLLDPVPTGTDWGDRDLIPWPAFVYRGWGRGEAAARFRYAAASMGIR